jgi:hypothetical protein
MDARYGRMIAFEIVFRPKNLKFGYRPGAFSSSAIMRCIPL